MNTPTFTPFDAQMMARALRLAERGRYFARPNPMVGCVITQGESIVGEGFHQRFGQAHAEVNAIADAGDSTQGATAYVTLEPCAHQGKTGPCAKALIAAGIKKVICAMRDPNPRVDGGGFRLLEDAGIEVHNGLMEAEACLLNRGFIKRMTQNRPWVRLKLAMSVDGRTAMANGESQWITGPNARLDVQRLRAESDAILTGSGTVSFDKPSMIVRTGELAASEAGFNANDFKQPTRVVIDRHSQLDLTNPFFAIESPIWLVGQNPIDDSLPTHISRKTIASSDTEFFDSLLAMMASENINDVLVEAGPTLAGAMINAGCVDELVVYMAPKLMGSSARPLAELPFDAMNEAVELRLADSRMVGDDCRLTYLVKTSLQSDS